MGLERPPGAQIVQPPSSRAEKRRSINIYVVKFSIVCGEWPQDLCQLCFMAWLDTCREKKMFTLKIVVVKVMVLQDVLWIRSDHCIAWLPLLADWGCSKCKLPKLLSLSFNVINQNQNKKALKSDRTHTLLSLGWWYESLVSVNYPHTPGTLSPFGHNKRAGRGSNPADEWFSIKMVNAHIAIYRKSSQGNAGSSESPNKHTHPLILFGGHKDKQTSSI